MKRFHWVALVLCLQIGLCLSSFAEGFTTNIISGVSTNVSGTYVVGESGSFNYLQIESGGALTSGEGILGDQLTSANNMAIVTDSNSVWNAEFLLVGEGGSSNLLIVANGGGVNATAYIGDDATANGNTIVVTGTNSIWNGPLIIGNFGSGNQLRVTGGAHVVDSGSIQVGANASSGNNMVLIEDPGSQLVSSNRLEMAIGSDNQFVITNGGAFGCVSAFVGLGASTANNNSIVVSGSNTVWRNSGSLQLGGSSPGNSLSINGGAFVSNTTVVVGAVLSSSNNTGIVDGPGTVWNGRDFYWGEDSANNQLIVTNGALIKSGTLVIGDGRDAPSNSVIVTGNSTIWSNTGPLYVGYGGSGCELLVQDGAQVVGNANVDLGFAATGGSILSITGTNSRVTGSGRFTMDVGCRLLVSGGAKFTSGSASIAYSGSANIATITSSNSAWNIGGSLFIGMSGTSNQLVVSDGAAVSNGDCNIGSNTTASGNLVLVSGTNTVWNAGCVSIGGSTGNGLIVSNGATVIDSCINIDGGPSNQVVVTGSNTTCHGGAIAVGAASVSGGFEDVLRVENGAQLLSDGADAQVGSAGNNASASLTGPNSSWISIGLLTIGQASSAQLTIADGASLQATHVIVLAPPPSAPPPGLRNTALVLNDGGTLIVTNATGDAKLELQWGDTILNGGVVMANNMLISNRCQVTGCGTIIGNVSNLGTFSATCPGGEITISGAFTNNATVIATNNADIEFLGPVVNNGTIDLVNGFGHFTGGLINHGTYRDAASILQIPSLSFTGSNAVIGFGCVSGKTYAVEYTDDLAASNWSTLVGNVLGVGGITQFVDTGAANLPQRFYRVHLTLP